MGPGKFGLKADGLAQSVGSLLQFPLLFQNRAQSVVRLGIVGPHLDRGLKFVGRARKLSLLPEDDAERVTNVSLFRIKFGRLP